MADVEALCEREHQCRRCNNFRDPGDLAPIEGLPFCDGFGDRKPTCWERSRQDRIGLTHRELPAQAIGQFGSNAVRVSETPRKEGDAP